VEAHRLAAWRDEFMAGGLEGLKARPLAPEDRRVKEAERKIGEVTLENEILQAAVRKRGAPDPAGGGGRGERRDRCGPGQGVPEFQDSEQLHTELRWHRSKRPALRTSQPNGATRQSKWRPRVRPSRMASTGAHRVRGRGVRTT
jgi:hypothetical protein